MRISKVFRSSAIAIVAVLSVMFGALPAQATGALTIDPSQPTFVRGGLSPALTITTDNIAMPPTVKTLSLKMRSGSWAWNLKNTCVSTPSSTLSDCEVVSVKVTDNGVTTNYSSAVKVAESVGQLAIIFDNALQQVQAAPNTRIIEIVLSEGAFTVSPTANSLDVELEIQSAPVNGATMSSIHSADFTSYAGVSFNGGADSVGSMQGILASTNSTLPANSFTKTGYNFAGWSCSQGGQVQYADQAVMTSGIYSCPTLYAVWTPVGGGSGGGSNGGSGSNTASGSNPTSLATTGSEGYLYLLAGLFLTFAGISLYSGSIAARRKQR